jgi:predicted RNA-binding Zn-ribbon protein involved in translation (DUF1610 family)
MEIPTLECKRCKHKWYPRKPELPLVCPNCGSPYWNREKVKFKKTDVMENDKQGI